MFLKKLFNIIFCFILLFPVNTRADFFGWSRVKDDLKGNETSLDVSITNYITYILLFLYFLAVVYGIWGGFIILTAAGNEDKVKKGKSIVLMSIVGIIIIFLAGPIVRFILEIYSN